MCSLAYHPPPLLLLLPRCCCQAYMDSTYITVDNYLASCGLTKDEISAIRNNLLQPGAPREAPAGSNEAPSEKAQAAAAAAAAAVGTGPQGGEL
jgi:hypothetical protein